MTLYLWQNEQWVGPYSDEQIQELLNGQAISSQDFIWDESWPEARIVRDVWPVPDSPASDLPPPSPEPAAPLEPPALEEPETYKYWAFISYSHADKAWADWLHRALETYRVPARLVGRETERGYQVPKRIYPVFRDRDELPGSADLGENISRAIQESRYLVVICSPRSAASRWVNEEIVSFKSLGRESRVLGLIIDGEPNATDKPACGLPECFPEALRYRVGPNREILDARTEPIAPDARPGKDGRPNAKLKLLAGILGVDFDELRQRDRQRQQARLIWSAALALAACVVVAVLVWNALSATRTAGAALTERDRQIYLSDMEAAHQLWTEDDLGQLGHIVARYEHPVAGDPRGFEWYYWKHLLNSPALATHTLPAVNSRSLVFDASGKYLAVLDGLGQASVWDWAQDKQLYSLPHHAWTIQFTPDSREVVTTPFMYVNTPTATNSPNIEIWDAASGQPISTFKCGVGLIERVCAAISPDGTSILVNCGENSNIMLLDFPSGKLKVDFTGPSYFSTTSGTSHGPQYEPVTDVRWRDDGLYFATAHDNGKIQVWGTEISISTGSPINATLDPGPCTGFAFSPDYRFVASQSFSGLQASVKTWGNLLVFDSHDNVGVGRVMKEWPVHSMKPFLDEAPNAPDISSQPDNPKALYEALKCIPGSFSPAFDAGGRRLFTTGERSVQVWDPLSAELLYELNRTGSPVAALAVNPSTATLASADPKSVTVSSIGPRTARLICESTKLLYSIAVSPDGSKVAGVAEDDQGMGRQDINGVLMETHSLGIGLKMWDAESGKELFSPKSHAGDLLQPWFSTDGQTMGIGSEAWNTGTQQPMPNLTDDKLDWQHLIRLIPSPDGKMVLRTTKIPHVHGEHHPAHWRMEIVHRDTGKTDLLRDDENVDINVAFSPDSRFLATAGKDQIIHLWQLADGKALPSLPAQPVDITALAFSPDGKRLAIGRVDHTVEIWSVTDGTFISRHTGQKREISGIAFFPDGRRIVSCSGLTTVDSQDAGDVHLWDPDTGQLYLDFPNDRHEIYAGIVVSADGHSIYAATNDTREIEANPLANFVYGNPSEKMPPPPIAGRIIRWDAPEK